MVTDPHGRILYVNAAFEKDTGYTAEDVIGQTPEIFCPVDINENYHQQIRSAHRIFRVIRHVTINKKKNNQIYYVDQTISPLKDKSGQTVRLVSVCKDMTERVKAEQRIIKLNKKLETENFKLEQVLSIEQGLNTLLDINKLVDFVVAKTVQVLEARRCSLMLCDEKEQELCIRGHNGLDENIIKESRIKIGGPSIAGQVAQSGTPVLVSDVEKDRRFLRKNKSYYRKKSFIIVPIKLGDNLIGVINVTEKSSPKEKTFTELDLKILQLIARQVAVAIETAKLFREVKYLTITDASTNLYNYRHFTKSLDHEIKRVECFQRPLCLLMMCLENIGPDHSPFAHLEHDILLKEVGKVIKENLHNVDTAYHYVGDEFVVILPETMTSDAEMIAEKILRNSLELSFMQSMSLNIGIAEYGEGMNRRDLILKANSALYKAKKDGKNKICAYA